jgi:hypothetical protein
VREIRWNRWNAVINMINFPMFIEGLLLPSLGLGAFVVYKRSKRKNNNKFYERPTNKPPS